MQGVLQTGINILNFIMLIKQEVGSLTLRFGSLHSVFEIRPQMRIGVPDSIVVRQRMSSTSDAQPS